MYIAATHIDASGQRVQDRVSPGGLRCVGVLLQPGPDKVCQRPMMPEQMRRFPYGTGLDAGDCRRVLGRHRAAEFGEVGEGRTAQDWAFAPRNRDFAGQCEPDRRLIISAGPLVITYGRSTSLVPGDEAILDS